MEKKVLNRLRECREEIGISSPDLAAMLHCEPSTVTRMETGERGLPDYRIVQICDTLRISPNKLLGYPELNMKEINHVPVPLLGKVCAGSGIEMIAVDDEITVPVETLRGISYERKKGIFALRVEGRSMNQFAQPGSIVLVDGLATDWSLLDGKIVVFERAGKVAMKRYQAKIKALLPQSDDPTFEPEPLDDEVRLLGKALWALKSGG